MAGIRVDIEPGYIVGEGPCVVATLSYPTAGTRRTKASFAGSHAAAALTALVLYLRCGGLRTMNAGEPIDLDAVDTSRCTVRFSDSRKRP